MDEFLLRRKYEEYYAGRAVMSVRRTHGWPRNRIEAVAYVHGAGEQVLEIGCGDGAALFLLRERYRKLIGTEYSESRLKQAEERLKDWDFSPVLARNDSLSQIESESVDRVISSDVLEHVVDVYFHVEEIRRVLKPGGDVVVNTPNVASMRHRFQLLMGRFPSTSECDEGFGQSPLYDGGHLHYFTFGTCRRLFERAGFVTVGMMGFGPCGRLHDVWRNALSGAVQLHARKP